MDEDVRTILQHLLELREDLKSTEERLQREIVGVREDLRSTEERLQGEIVGLRGDLRSTEERLQGEIVGLQGEMGGLRGDLRSTEERLQGEIIGLREETAERFDRVETDVRHTNILVESLAGDIRLVAEGVDNANERLDRAQKENAREFQETRSEIRRAYSDLDGRVRRLEAASA
ncbi:MAG: hypothetical protein ACJ75H_10310 [Thermoanaerobaculia bacterium]